MTPRRRWERDLINRFTCPGCGAKNTPTITVIQLARTGDARCSHCGREAPAKQFLPAAQDDA